MTGAANLQTASSGYGSASTWRLLVSFFERNNRRSEVDRGDRANTFTCLQRGEFNLQRPRPAEFVAALDGQIVIGARFQVVQLVDVTVERLGHAHVVVGVVGLERQLLPLGRLSFN
jgi:hypothetical protein